MLPAKLFAVCTSRNAGLNEALKMSFKLPN